MGGQYLGKSSPYWDLVQISKNRHIYSQSFCNRAAGITILNCIAVLFSFLVTSFWFAQRYVLSRDFLSFSLNAGARDRATVEAKIILLHSFIFLSNEYLLYHNTKNRKKPSGLFNRTGYFATNQISWNSLLAFCHKTDTIFLLLILKNVGISANAWILWFSHKLTLKVNALNTAILGKFTSKVRSLDNR